MTPETITACAAIAAVVVAIAGSAIASKSRKDFRLSLAADLAMKLDDRFNADACKSIRSSAAKAFLTSDNLAEAEDIFDFFETLGLLVRTKAITRDLAYNFFFHWINLYWNAGKNYISRRRQNSKTLWTDFEFIYDEVLKIEKQKDPKSRDIAPSTDLLREYLEQEVEQ